MRGYEQYFVVSAKGGQKLGILRTEDCFSLLSIILKVVDLIYALNILFFGGIQIIDD